MAESTGIICGLCGLVSEKPHAYQEECVKALKQILVDLAITVGTLRFESAALCVRYRVHPNEPIGAASNKVAEILNKLPIGFTTKGL